MVLNNLVSHLSLCSYVTYNKVILEFKGWEYFVEIRNILMT